MANPSVKHLQIDKAQSVMLLVVAVATIITVFCLVSTKALLSQSSYHRKELSAKRTALKQLNANVSAADALATQYNLFDGGNPNAIGGKNSHDQNTTPPDGDNARIILDALPSKYDFPALISSLSKILAGNGVLNAAIGGSDQSATISSNPTTNPQAIAIPISVSGITGYGSLQNLIKDFERSIRPFDITTLQLKGNAGSMALSANLNTYFQPAKSLGTSTKEVK